MSVDTLPVPDFDDMLQFVRRMYEEKIPFNRTLGLQTVSLSAEGARVCFQMAPNLVGNYAHGTLHGGVISAILDAAGGMTASVGVLTRMAGQSLEALESRLTRLGTIDLRVDYLRPGRGRRFTAGGVIMRTGNKVAVVRMELTNESGLLIAVGTGTYLVG